MDNNKKTDFLFYISEAFEFKIIFTKKGIIECTY